MTNFRGKSFSNFSRPDTPSRRQLSHWNYLKSISHAHFCRDSFFLKSVQQKVSEIWPMTYQMWIHCTQELNQTWYGSDVKWLAVSLSLSPGLLWCFRLRYQEYMEMIFIGTISVIFYEINFLVSSLFLSPNRFVRGPPDM